MSGSPLTDPVPGQSTLNSTSVAFPAASETDRAAAGSSPAKYTGANGFESLLDSGVTLAKSDVRGHSPPCHSCAIEVVIVSLEAFLIFRGKTKPRLSLVTDFPAASSIFSPVTGTRPR
jgi:hypothetical protein